MGLLLKVAGVYKHFKGKKYVVMGISKPVKTLFKGNDLHTVYHTGLNVNLGILSKGYTHYHSSSIDKNLLVLYKQVSPDTKIYACSMDDFLAEVDKEKYPQANQKYVMEEVK